MLLMLAATALVLHRLLKGAVFGIGELTPLPWIAAPLFLLLVATAASLSPASRAATVNPVDALRCKGPFQSLRTPNQNPRPEDQQSAQHHL